MGYVSVVAKSDKLPTRWLFKPINNGMLTTYQLVIRISQPSLGMRQNHIFLEDQLPFTTFDVTRRVVTTKVSTQKKKYCDNLLPAWTVIIT